jgi:hypothetical protein
MLLPLGSATEFYTHIKEKGKQQFCIFSSTLFENLILRAEFYVFFLQLDEIFRVHFPLNKIWTLL